MLIAIILLILALCLFIYSLLPVEHINVEERTVKMMKKIHGPKGIPFLGMAHYTVSLKEENYLQFLKGIMDNYKRLTSLWIVGMPFVIMQEPEDIEMLLSSTNHITKGLEYEPITPWLKEGLLNSTGDKWRRRRKVLTSAFHFSILSDNLPSINKHAKLLLRNLLNENGRPLVVEDYITLCALDVICETAMGYSMNTQANNGKEYVQAVKRIESTIVHRIMSFYFRKDWFFNLMPSSRNFYKDLNTVHSFTDKVIKEKREQYIAEQSKRNKDQNLNEINEDDLKDVEFIPKKRKAFLDSVMELMDSSLTTDQEIREEIETFMFAGHDTISTASTFALYELGRNPDIQEKLYAEMQTIFGDSDRDPTRKDLNEMHYLDNVIKETLRLYPSVPYISRKLLQDLELKDGTVIPRGANCAMVPYFLHRHPKYFPNPEVFDPARFNYDNSRKRHPFVYIPFSAGPRNCIGQKYAVLEMKVILSTIIRFAQIETVTKPEDFTVLPLLILRTSSPIKVKITPRNKFIC